MSRSELVTTDHLTRKAVIYIRQSTPHQVLTNQESLHLQYALRQRAIHLGWRNDDIDVIDTDLGLTAVEASHRAGFKELVTRVTLGQVGLILSLDVTRLSRNLTDWYPLLDICGFKGCLIADRDGVYDPATQNGRLLLGLKGTLSEMEMHTIRARLTTGLLHKAARGELALSLPIGLTRDPFGRVQKTPDQAVQHGIALIFQTFLRVRTASKVLQHFSAHGLNVPGRDRFGDLQWKKPTISAILAVLKNPAYAGAFVYGRSRAVRRAADPSKTIQKPLPIEQWKIRLNDKYPAYVSWDTFLKIGHMLKDNYAEYDRHKTRGVPRAGAALLHGLLYCGECGHKMMVQYKHCTLYLCNALRQKYGVPVCQNIPADWIDDAVVNAFFQALSPVELDLYARAMAAQQHTDEHVERARAQRLERLRYQAALAQRQYNRRDPDNRLVAAELEARWEAALRELKQAEDAATQARAQTVVPFVLTAELKAAFSKIGERLPHIWEQPILSPQQRKALLRCLIDKVALHRVGRSQAQVRIVWRGGETTTLLVSVRVRTLAALPAAAEMARLIIDLFTQGYGDEEIAKRLTALGHRSPTCRHVRPNTVKIIRLKHRLFQKHSQSHPRRIAGYLTVPQIARTLEVPVHWLYDHIHRGTIEVPKDPTTGLYVFPDQPHTLKLFKDLKAGKRRTLRFHEDPPSGSNAADVVEKGL
jgi:DNA invertase Pin-like site-specific DNA recombinase